MAKTRKVALIILFFGLLPFGANAASLYITPTSGSFEVGERVTVRVNVSSSEPINAVSGVVSFPTSIFNIESISKAGSILNFWVSEPNFSGGAGTLNFEGVVLGGFPGGAGTVVTAALRAVRAGTGEVLFKSGQVLANDGQGTDVTSGLTGGTFAVVEKKESSKPVTAPTSKPEEILEPLEPEEPQKKPTLEPPEILHTKKYGEPAILGTSHYPRAQVLLTFVSGSGVKIFIMGVSDASGEFLLLVPQTLKRGAYKVSAVVIKEDTTNSYPSNEITIKVGNIFSDISREVGWALSLLALTLAYLILRSYVYFKRNKSLKKFVRKEAEEAEEIVHKSFKVLNEDVDYSLNKKTSSVEEEHMKGIKEDLKEAEKIIEKEIKDIEKT